MNNDKQLKYKVFRDTTKRFWKKSYYWVVYDEIAGPFMVGWTWTYKGALNDADLYIMKVDDGRYFK